MPIPKQKSSSKSNNGFFDSKFKKTKRPQAENKNSILNKFRIELNKSQSIISKELIRSKELKLKFLKKRKKQQAEEEAKQLLLKNSPQNLNLINIQNNIINNSTGFKHRASTICNFTESLNKKNENLGKGNASPGENSMNNTNSLKKTTNTNNNNITKEDFFTTEVKVAAAKTSLKNALSPMKDKKFERLDTSRNSNIMSYNNNSNNK
jgi:hypothetical protein